MRATRWDLAHAQLLLLSFLLLLQRWAEVDAICTQAGQTCNDYIYCNGADWCSADLSCSVHEGDPCWNAPTCGLSVCDETAKKCVVAAAGTTCNDFNYCNGIEICDGNGQCLSAGNPCSGGTTCENQCNEAADNCYSSTSTPCTSDFNECTEDKCDGAGNCVHNPVMNGMACSDGIPCSNPDTCQAGACVPGPSVCGCQANSDCDDNNTCTVDICTVYNFNGTCSFAPAANNTLCNDSIWCNGDNDICIAGTCVGEFSLPLTRCSNGTPCNDTCSEAMNACMSPNGISCSNGFFCDGEELCLSGSCAPGSPPCAGSCDEVEGICRTTSGSPPSHSSSSSVPSPTANFTSSIASSTTDIVTNSSTISTTNSTTNSMASSTTLSTESSSATPTEPGFVSGSSANSVMIGGILGAVGGALLLTAGVVAAVSVRRGKRSTSLTSSVSDAELSSPYVDSMPSYAKSPSSLREGDTYAKTPSAAASTYAKTPATETNCGVQYAKTPVGVAAETE